MLDYQTPALILAPMQGVTDAPMRAVQGESGAFSFAVSEFVRINSEIPGKRVFHRYVPELCTDGRTLTGLPVQVQLLGGNAERMAEAAVMAHTAGAQAIDINFGCPAATVNRHDGGATLLKYPGRIREIVAAVRAALPPGVPVSAKLRLGWDSIESIHENADMAAEGGASWLTIHARTRVQGYTPPVYWKPIGVVRERLGIPVVANGDIWSIEGFRQCREETGCIHFMLGRGALSDPMLPRRIAKDLGIATAALSTGAAAPFNWIAQLERLIAFIQHFEKGGPHQTLQRLKQWLNFASRHGEFDRFDSIKLARTTEELLQILEPDCCSGIASAPLFS